VKDDAPAGCCWPSHGHATHHEPSAANLEGGVKYIVAVVAWLGCAGCAGGQEAPFDKDGERQLDPTTGRPMMLGDVPPDESAVPNPEPHVTAIQPRPHT
jgi:hypothetical protein